MSDFEDWLLRGPGEAMLGSALRSAATNEKRRLQRKLETPNLFPHIEHEDKAAMERAEHQRRQGQKMVDRCRRRSEIIKALLP
jgi:hypothetical protein